MAGYLEESERAAARRRSAIGDYLKRAISGEGVLPKKRTGPTVPNPVKPSPTMGPMAQNSAERTRRMMGIVPPANADTQRAWEGRTPAIPAASPQMPNAGMNVPNMGTQRQPVPVLDGRAYRYDTQGAEADKYGSAIFSDTMRGATPEGFDADMAQQGQGASYARAMGAVKDAAQTLPFGRTPEEQQAIEENVRGILSSVPQELADARRAAADRGDFGSVWNSYLSGPDLSALDEQRRLERQASTIPYLSQTPSQYMAALMQRRSALGDLKRRQEQSAAISELAMNQFNENRNYGIDVMNAETNRMKAEKERGNYAINPIKDMTDQIIGYTVVDKNSGAITALDPSGNVTMQYGIGQGGMQPQVPNPGGMAPGTVVDGYRFIGGNPSDPNSWEEA